MKHWNSAGPFFFSQLARVPNEYDKKLVKIHGGNEWLLMKSERL